MGRFIAAVVLVLAAVAGGVAVWLYRTGEVKSYFPVQTRPSAQDDWLGRFDSQNPSVAEAAEHEIGRLGGKALPTILEVLRDPAATPARKKAALRACAVIGPLAQPAIPEITAHLPTPDYAAEAAVALSLIGRDAYRPLSDSLASPHGEVRKEALRALGKLHFRAPLEASYIVPPLLDALADDDAGVRTVAATYLGMIHQYPEASVPALVEMLQDENPEVRTAAATALGSFGGDAQPALPALRKAQGDKDENVAREAGLALVKLQPKAPQLQPKTP